MSLYKTCNNTLTANSNAYSFALSDPRLDLLMTIAPSFPAVNGTGLFECTSAQFTIQLSGT
jgi:hypothetical protein